MTQRHSELGIRQSEINAYWEQEVCGTRFSSATDDRIRSEEITTARYEVEPFIADFAEFSTYSPATTLLEVGVGAGTDFIQWLRTGGSCHGIDATEAAIELTLQRIQLEPCPAPVSLRVADGENLPFPDGMFDLVYSYGVIHHAADTQVCLDEIFRVLKPGGEAKIMVYSNLSVVGFLLWLIHGVGQLRPFQSQRKLISKYLESPGTKAFGKQEFRGMLERAGLVPDSLVKKAGSGDLLLMPPSQKYSSRTGLYSRAQRLYPRRIVRRFEAVLGLALLATAHKPLL